MASAFAHLSGSGHVEDNASADGGSRSIRDKATRSTGFCYADDEGRLHGMTSGGYGSPLSKSKSTTIGKSHGK
ncbi:hypothetical protein REPUB_Repub13aG0008700 [Reevesia pubescens]